MNSGEMQKELFGWLDAITTHENFESYLSAHLPGTCDWIFRNAAYCGWISPEFEDDLAKFLWVHGPAGHGKSVLCAQIIRSLKDASKAPVAYFFCSSDNKTQREPLAIIRSWIWQAINSHENALDQAVEKFRAKEMRLASRNDIWKLFRSIIDFIPNYTFVIDGLDECLRSSNDWRSSGNSSRIDFLISLKASVAHTRTRILIVSRDEGDIRSEMSPDTANTNGQRLYECRLSKETLNPDVSLFSKSVVNRKLANKDGALREDLAAQMAETCDGMFLLIRLQENQLSRSKNKKQLQAIVSNMPRELEHAYIRDWEYISGLPSCDRLRALDILRWVTFAIRPLTVLEITEALIIKDNDNYDDLQSDDLPDDIDRDFVDEQIIGLCGSLLEVRSSNVEKIQSPGSSTIHLAHFSVKEYLLAMIPDKNTIFSSRNSQNGGLAKLCLRYLNYPKVWISSSPPGDKKGHHSFLNYAVTSWHKHAVMDSESDQELIDLTNHFFTPGNPTWGRWRQHFEFISEPSLSQTGEESSLSDIEQPEKEQSFSDIDQPEKEPSFSDIEQQGEELSLLDITQVENKPGTLIYYAALFGLVDTIKFLQDQKEFNPNELGGKHVTALQAACEQGNLLTVGFLIDSGADINLQGVDYKGSAPLNRAAYRGHLEIVKLLLDRGADTAVFDEDGDTPLMNAIYDGHIEVARILLDRGADHAIANKHGYAPLSSAAYWGHLEIVKLLLDRGADTAVVDEDGNTPLMYAIDDGHIEVARILLDRGADHAIAKNHGYAPLSIAAYKGHLEIVKLLLDRGADTAVVDGDGNTPLMCAIHDGHIEVARILLDRGADHAIAKNHGYAPLSSAAYWGHLEIVKLLLDRGADMAVVDEDGNTPLMCAIHDGHIEVARILLDRGADHAIANKHGSTPLGKAAHRGHLEIVKLLLDRGADTAVFDEDGDTPLMNAIYDGHIKVVRPLLEMGTDPDVAENKNSGFTPLNFAAYKGHLEIAKLLLERGADPNIANKHGNPPIHGAAQDGHLEIVNLLLENGADQTVVDQDGDSSLMCAIIGGHLEVIKLLLDKGASLAISNNAGLTPLSLAAEQGHLEVVKFLLDRGVDAALSSEHLNKALDYATAGGHLEVIELLNTYSKSRLEQD